MTRLNHSAEAAAYLRRDTADLIEDGTDATTGDTAAELPEDVRHFRPWNGPTDGLSDYAPEDFDDPFAAEPTSLPC